MALYKKYLENEFAGKWKNLSFPKSGLARNKLVEILNEQNKNASISVKANIDSLNNESTYAVVTGQQMGLMGGPLYTIYKTLNTVLICKELNERYEDKHFVPILWMEGEDADFDEVSYINYFKENEIRKFTYSDSGKLSIGKRVFDLAINDLSYILGTEQPFESERAWVDAFYLYFKSVLDEFGIIAFHSNNDSVYEANSAFWKTVVSNHKKISDKIFSKSNALKKSGETLQVEIPDDETFLFKHDKNERKKIKNLNEIDLKQDILSPNVLLRPLYQDYIFPTVVYVAGNAEISYQMQISEAYEQFDREAPVLFPRTHHIVLNPKMNRLLERYNYKEKFEADIFKEWMEESLKTELNDLVDKKLDQFRTKTKHFLDELNALEFTDEHTRKTLLEGYNVRQNKILNQLQKKMNNLIKRKDSEKIRHFHYLESLIFPKNSLQERFYPVCQFDLNVLSFSKQIIEQMNIHDFDFQVAKIK